jgi:hypothetical protein
MVEMTTLPAIGSTGTWGTAVRGIATIAKSPAAAASVAVAALALGPSSATRPASVCGPLRVADHDLVPVSDRALARLLPTWPLPIIPMVVMIAVSGGLNRRA